MEAYTLDDFKDAMRQVQASCSDAGKKRKAGEDAPKPPKGVVLYAFTEKAAEVERELETAGIHVRRRLKDANTLSMLECTVGSVGKTGGNRWQCEKNLTVAVKFVTSHAFGLRAFCDNFMWLYGGGLEYKGDGVGSVMTQAFLQLMTVRLLEGAAFELTRGSTLKVRHIMAAMDRDAGLKSLLAPAPGAKPDAQGGGGCT
jgi:hypothetical protein